jgi:phosphate transport system permease protein
VVKPPSSSENIRETVAADFDRPLLLTPGQDLGGYVLGVIGKGFLTLITSLTILSVFLLFIFIIVKAWPYFQQRGIGELLFSKDWHPTSEHPEFGAASMFYGSAIVTLGAMFIAVPVGLLAAVCLSDILSFRARNLIKPIIEILAAIPSVAYGFFAVLVVAPWLQKNLGLQTGTNALNASLLLAVMAVPTIVSISEDALFAVGRELREGAYALGATRAEMLIKVVIPAAHSGIIAAIILGIMRAVGETMAVWMASGMSAHIPPQWWDLTQSVRTLTATIAQEMGEAPKNGLHRQALFAIGLSLLLMTFVLNMISEHFLNQSKRIRQGMGKK